MSPLRNHFGFALFTIAWLVASHEYCQNGNLPVCLDGSIPAEYLGLAERSTRSSVCPEACNPTLNTCDSSTAPTCIYPDPRVENPRGACACQPGYKATGYTDNDISKHWRLPVAAQEHRVWVAEGVKCGTPCDVSSEVKSCREVTLIADECIGTVPDDYDQFLSDLAAIPVKMEMVHQARRDLQNDSQDPILFLKLIEVEGNSSTAFNLDNVVSQLAVENGVDLDKPPPDDLELALEPPSTNHPTGRKLIREVVSNAWAQAAQKKGSESYLRSWRSMVTSLSKAADSIGVAKQPKLCPEITRSVINSCKRGVRTQVAFCKQALRDSIAQCKNDVRRSIDKCKKKVLIPISCEAGRLTEEAKCEMRRIDIPFCEFDRLVAGCCEGSRLQAQSMCSSGFSTANIQKQIQKVQAACSVATALAKSAVKSYLSGQVLGVITELQSIKEIGDTVQIIGKVERTRAQYEKWADGLTAAAEGRLQDAKQALGSLASQITPDISNAVAWAEAAQIVVTKNVDGFLAKLASAAGEIDQVMLAKGDIDKLKTVTNDIKAIQAAARECAKVPASITPDEFLGWKDVTSEETLNTAVAAYERSFAAALFASARCRAVVVRAGRAISA